jgi:drug/metabolite transporter (DMT)-like permease
MRADGQSHNDARRVAFGPGELWASASAFGYAFAAIFSRVASVAIHPFVAPGLRLLPVVAVAWTRVLRQGTELRRLDPRTPSFLGWRVLAIICLGGTFTTVIGTVGYFYALRIGGVVLTQPVLATSIFWSAFIAAIFLGEPLTRRMIIGVIFAVLGVALLGYGRSVGGNLPGNVLLALPLAFIPAVTWAAGSNCTRYALVKGVDKYLVLAVSNLWAIVLLFGVLIVAGQGGLITSVSLHGLGSVLLAGVLTAASQITITYALSFTSVASVSTINGMNPVLAAILAYFILGEPLNALMVAGTILTVIGVIFVQVTKVNVASPQASAPGDALG